QTLLQTKGIHMTLSRKLSGPLGFTRGFAFFAALIWLPAAAQTPTPTPSQTEWPKVIVRNGVTNTIYQPQLESWEHETLKANSAVSVQAENSRDATFGVINFTAKTHVDRVEREVLLENVKITSAKFPSASQKADQYLATFRSILPQEVPSI